MTTFLYPFIFALHITGRGCAYVLFESPLAPYDWGIKRFTGGKFSDRLLRFVTRTLDYYQPVAMVLEDWRDDLSQFSARTKALYDRVAALAKKKGVAVYRYTRKQIRATFAHLGAITKYDIAVEIAKRILAFAHRLPPERKAWMGSDPRQGLYDAAAVCFTYYAGHARKEVFEREHPPEGP